MDATTRLHLSDAVVGGEGTVREASGGVGEGGVMRVREVRGGGGGGCEGVE